MNLSFANMTREQVNDLITEIITVYQDRMYELTESDGPPVS